jgi:hypothetical protein
MRGDPSLSTTSKGQWVMSCIVRSVCGDLGYDEGRTFFTSGSLAEWKKYENSQSYQEESRAWLYSLKPSTNQSLSIEDGVSWVHSSLVFGGIADQTFLSGEGNVGWCRAVSLCKGVSSFL